MKFNFYLVLFIFSFNISVSHSQDQIIKGIVTDIDGTPLPLVSIMEQNTNNGVVTNFDGVYEIKLKQLSSVLVFTYLGFKTKHIKVTSSKLNVKMEMDAVSLDEIVISSGIQLGAGSNDNNLASVDLAGASQSKINISNLGADFQNNTLNNIGGINFDYKVSNKLKMNFDVSYSDIQFDQKIVGFNKWHEYSFDLTDVLVDGQDYYQINIFVAPADTANNAEGTIYYIDNVRGQFLN